MNDDWALLTDLYQLTMAQGYWQAGKERELAAFTMSFRDYPFGGGFAVACGMTQLAQIVDEYTFTPEHMAYLSSLEAPQGGALFDPRFLAYLKTLELSLDIDGVAEGSVVFPHEPLLRVTGPIMQCQLIETVLLNCVSFQTLIATKAARVCLAAKGTSVAEFGLRRAQGLGGTWASRAAVIGGCSSTSNVLADKRFDIPVSGTHAHSWVMAFDSELEAFREYARRFPANCTLLVDTYDVTTGIQNAITVGLEMRDRGQRLQGIRIDSGDLAWTAKTARHMLDEAGLGDVKIVLSNDLDEYLVRSIMNEGAPVDAWGIGTKLACAFDQAALGGVYKLNAIRQEGDARWSPRLKISESSAKLTTPGILDVRRYRDEMGKLAGDMVFDVNRGVQPGEVIIDPLDPLRTKSLEGMAYAELLQPLVKDGKPLAQDARTTMQIREFARDELSHLDESQLRLLNPHTYPVGIEQGLEQERRALVTQMRGEHPLLTRGGRAGC